MAHLYAQLLGPGELRNSYVDCSVRRPGSSILLLSPVRCRCLSTDYLHGLGCRDCLSFTSDSTQESREDAAVLLTSARKQTMDLGLLQLLNWKDGVCK
ncbi:mCG63513, isoform CRA_b [Mus musculus]|nr:mCG63513, isoform CRA_b [Mus musculus]